MIILLLHKIIIIIIRQGDHYSLDNNYNTGSLIK